MPKLLSLEKILEKKFKKVEGLTADMEAHLGEIEDAFDMIIYGDSGNGKTNLTLEVVAQLCQALNCGATYVGFEEGHGKSFVDALKRNNVLQRIGNVIDILDGGTDIEIEKRLNSRKSKKIWIFDSIQASNFSYDFYKKLKQKYVQGKRRKIFISISWVQGKKPKGAVAENIRYYANIKTFVDRFIAFTVSRYGSKKNYIIWQDGALKAWGKKLFKQHLNN